MKLANKSHSFIYNLFYAFAAQAISLFVSFLMSLIVPKLLGITEFGYWQLFIFYSGYVGFFHFGLNDGVYLKYGGNSYKDLDNKLLGSQFWASMLLQTVIAVGVIMYAFIYTNNDARIFVLISAAVCLILVNASGFIGYIFQAVNLTRIYSLSVIIDKVFFIAAVFILLFIRETDFRPFVLLYLLSKFASLIYCIYKGKEIIFVHIQNLKTTFVEISKNIAIGINLMAANIASMLILGAGQLFIDQRWGINAFGKISFSLSLTNLFLVFLAQFSMVLFPALRQSGSDNLNHLYQKIRSNFALIFLAIPLFYFPMTYVLILWLPQYLESLRYMIFLLPLCIFEGKMQVLCNTYLKVLRKERVLLGVNLIAMLISFALIWISVYVIQSIVAVVVSMVFSVIVRSIIAENYLSKLMNISTLKFLVQEISLSLIFMVATWFLPSFMAFIIYLLAYIVYLFINKSLIKEFGSTLSRKIRIRKQH
ncbi:oligosaccharide flippase family protein [Sporolactobacillus laevolacticus]|uniref:Polysaccharide transporter n=1 Tax=Sporolactobacillus laevolacticus DSM 442 TaxID=1395513 RepID=V6IZ90_9BACL|nr:oligosaccharide flippase family protein [Sporolactobacillus laevolacticus]EST12765.1 hypothetical protein P343_05890 [Sporolactobacillus laevolacticus DSM 442]